MKISKTQFLVAGLLAGTLTFVGCKSDKSGETPPGTDATQDTGTPTGEQPTEGTSTPPEGTGTEPGTGGSGSETKPSDDNLRMPEEDPMRTRDEESAREAESEPGVHDPATGGTGGSGFPEDDTMDEGDLNEGGNADEDFRVPDSPADTIPEEQLK
ncbi:MAG: hypothetical protein JXB05_10105 [Myxococcaceae bacterium]|nr:hypothetical protein [Myxococcaceae bacterium]